ncbi:aminotransferase-like domain-containing protein [Microbacterium terrisoli]|uniref:aminotransferase-like domain-containing protein n=1 Tax=Microbacterium terrisoli TaxID=3242192 RepID=UPI0028061619|nr:PLP-dependent aminotransferase family protein [Microbacterium protaetiae]
MSTPTSTIRMASRTRTMIGSIIDSSTALLASQKHDIVRFAMGAPNAELIPTADFDRLLGAHAPGRYDYGATEGEPELIAQVQAFQQRLGIDTEPERLLITTGGMQGLDLAFKLLLDPGDLVVVEAPTYTNGIGTALSYQAEVIEAPVDADGMIVEDLPDIVARAGRAPKVIYTIPNFQNPSGTTMSLARRQLLLELAEEWDAVIVDDDPYGALRFDGEDVPAFAQLSPGNPRVVQVRTFSKILAPGLRVGWVDVDPALRAKAIDAKQAMDTCTSVPTQRMVADYLSEGLLDAHLTRLRGVYRQRKQAMRRIMTAQFGDDVTMTDPQGGFFLWVALQGRLAALDTQKLFPVALRHGVAYIPGPAFAASGRFGNALRVCFATSTPERMADGVARLAAAVDEQVAP